MSQENNGFLPSQESAKKFEKEVMLERDIFAWISGNKDKNAKWPERDTFFDFTGGDQAFYEKMRTLVEARYPTMSFYSTFLGANKWRIGVVKKHEMR